MGKTDKAENKVKYSLEEKLEVLKIYMNEGVKEIKTNTVFISNGVKYKIGMWQQNFREDEAEGMLKNMSPEIREQMEAWGILKRERTKRTTDEERYEVIKDYIKKIKEQKGENYNVKIKYNTVSEDGIPIGRYCTEFKAKYAGMNKKEGAPKISPKLINELKKMGVIYDNYTEMRKETGLLSSEVKYIIDKYGSIEKFSKLFKMGEIKQEDLKPIKSEKLKNNRYIDIDNPGNDNEIYYSALCTGLFGENKDLGFYSKEKLDESLSTLDQREQTVLKLRFGLGDGEKLTFRELSGILNVSSRTWGQQLEVRAIMNLKNLIDSKDFFIARVLNKEELKEMIAQKENKIARKEKEIQQEESEITQEKERLSKDGIIYESQVISANGERIEDIKTEDLDLSTRPKRLLKKLDINRVRDFRNKSLKDLLMVKKLGGKSLEEIKRKLAKIGVVLPETMNVKVSKLARMEVVLSQKKEDLEYDTEMLKVYKQCQKCYDYYMSDEYSIFNTNVTAKKDLDQSTIDLSDTAGDTENTQNPCDDSEKQIKTDALNLKMEKIGQLDQTIEKLDQKLEEERADVGILQKEKQEREEKNGKELPKTKDITR